MKKAIVVVSEAKEKVPFFACNKHTPSGVCVGGTWVFRQVQFCKNAEGNTVPMYGGVPQQVAADCQCKIAWRRDKERVA